MTAAPAEIQTDSVFKPAMLLMCGRTLAFVATFFIPVVLARVFAPALFGVYKQLFLMQSTVYFIVQCGMATSLYYFLPRSPSDAGKYLANALLHLALAGIAAWGVFAAGASHLARWMSDPDLAAYLPGMGLYVFLMMLSAPLEMTLISRGRYLWASASYAISDLLRAAAFIAAALVFREIGWVVTGAVAVAAVRAVASGLYYAAEFRGKLRFDKVLLRRQLAYALPLGAAVLVEILQSNLPQYVVSHVAGPALFAVFAVGCLQIPLVDFAASPTSDVMMVKMQESLAAGRKSAVAGIWHDTTWRLALLFLPLTGMVLINARDLIVMLYTARYAASVPIFMAWTLTIPLVVLQVDGVMRVFAQTRFLLLLNLMRLAVLAALIRASLLTFQLLGPVLVMLLAILLFKIAALARMRSLLGVGVSGLLPWGKLGALTCAALVAAVAGLAIKTQTQEPILATIAVSSVVYLLVYTAVVWRFGLLDSEAEAIAGLWRRTTQVLNWGRG